MTQRLILCGADSIRFLGDHGFTFTLPLGHTKNVMPKGYNRPGAGHTVDEAIAHFERGNNVGALSEFGQLIDLDYFFPEQVAKLGNFARTARVWRNNAKERGALIYRVTDGPVRSATWTPEGSDSPHAELKAQNRKGNYDQKNIAGIHNGGEYLIIDAQYGVMEITHAELVTIWRILTGTELHAPKPAKARTTTLVERKPINGHDDLAAQVKAYWSPLKVFEHFGWVRNGTQDDGGGEIRILGHGGLLCKSEVWHSFADDKGGDAIDAWAHCTRRDRDYFRDILEEMAGLAGIPLPQRFRQPDLAPLPEGAVKLENGHTILKTTPTPEPQPRPLPPVCIPSVVAKLAEALRGPMANTLINRLGRVRDREGWRDTLIQLITRIAPAQGGWVFDAGQDWLGEQLEISGQAVRKKMHTMDSAGLIRYRHTGKVDRHKTGRSMMRVDLQPMIVDLWESCAKLENRGKQDDPEFSNFRNDPPPNVHVLYSGTGKYADASGRTLYKYAVERQGYPTVLARSVTKSALTALDYLARHGEATRAELVEEVGMSPGAAAGGTRVLEQLSLVSVEWDGPGTPKLYVLRPGWEERLRYLIPHMQSFGARIRLVIRNYDRWIKSINRQLDTTYAPQMRHQLNERKRKLETARRKWCDHGRRIGAYGRYVEINPPW
jgi:predicted ArsR family transcriptional regulator